MSEPEYTYVKGEGWVLHNGPRYIITHTKKGERIKLIECQPRVGQRHMWLDKRVSKYENSDGTLNLELLAEDAKLHILSWWAPRASSKFTPEHYHYVSVEVLND